MREFVLAALILALPAASAEVLYDSLSIVDNQEYFAANGDAIGGYGCTDWTSFGEMGYGVGGISQQMTTPPAEPASFTAAGARCGSVTPPLGATASFAREDRNPQQPCLDED